MESQCFAGRRLRGGSVGSASRMVMVEGLGV